MAKKSSAGRPPKYAEEKPLHDAVDKYFSNCITQNRMPNKAGLCVHLDISRDTYNEYRKKFPDTIKAADQWIEDAWVQRLGGANATGAIFYLKAAMGWQDKQEVDVTSGGQPLNIMWGTPNK